MAKDKQNEVDPNFNAVLERIDAFIPVMVAHMQRDLERESVGKHRDAELLAACEGRTAQAQAEQAEHEAAIQVEKLEQAKAKTAMLNTLMGEIARRVTEAGDKAMSTRELTETFSTLQRGY